MQITVLTQASANSAQGKRTNPGKILFKNLNNLTITEKMQISLWEILI